LFWGYGAVTILGGSHEACERLLSVLVDGANHAGLAMSGDAAVEEYRVRVVDGDGEEGLDNA
jgi:hypothetical protein